MTGGAVRGAIFGSLDNNAFRGSLGGLAADQFIEGRGDPCFEFDFTSIAIDGLSATGGALTGGLPEDLHKKFLELLQEMLLERHLGQGTRAQFVRQLMVCPQLEGSK